MHRITRKKRLAGVAALAFSGAVLLGACDGTGPSALCDTLVGVIQDLQDQRSDAEARLETVDPESVEADWLHAELAALDELIDHNQQQLDANCNPNSTET